MPLHRKAKTLDELEELLFEERRAFLQRLGDSGMTKAEAAEKMGRDRASFHRTLKRHGINWRGPEPAVPQNKSGRVVLSTVTLQTQLSQQEQADFATLKANGFTTREALTSIKRTDLMEDAHPRQETTREGA